MEKVMTRRIVRWGYLIAWLAVVGISSGQIATAEQGDPVPAAATIIEEIIVTAQRREQSLGDVSIAITAITGEDIVRLHMTDPSDLAQQAPNLQIKSVFSKSNPQIFMRGVGVNDDTALTNGSVGIYSDEVYVGAPAGQLFPIFDLERIEVLRGPQGTLYGRNTTGGAINFISRQPGENLEASFRAGVGSFDERTLEFGIGGPVSESVGARLAFVVNRRDGYMNNEYLDTFDATTDNWAARGLLRYDATEMLSLTLKIHGAKNDAQAQQFRSQGLLDPASVAAGAPVPCASPEIAGSCSDLLGYIDSPDPHRGQWDRRGKEEVDIAGASVNLTAMLGELELTSISAIESTDRLVRPDTDASPNQVLHIDWLETNDQFSQEFRLASPASSDIRWMAGVYYLNQEISLDQTNDVLRELRPMFGFDPSRLIVTINTNINQDLESYAAFGHIEFGLSERFDLVAGLRYTSEERDMNRLDAFVEPTFSIPLVQVSDSVSFSNLSGKLALEYRDDQDNLAYASVSSGFKSGGFNGAVALDPDSVPPFDEETLTTFELGYKWTGFADRLSINTAGFYTEYNDLQVFTRLTSGGIPREILTNAADASVLGLEVELSAIPTEGLELRMGLGLLDAELTDYRTDGGQDFSGNKLVGAPDVTLNGLVRKDFHVGNGTIALQADFYFQDDVFFETSNDPLLAQDAYWLLGGRISYRPLDKPWELALWGANLLDEDYLVSVVGLGLFGYNLQSWGEPRTWGIEFIWRR